MRLAMTELAIDRGLIEKLTDLKYSHRRDIQDRRTLGGLS